MPLRSGRSSGYSPAPSAGGSSRRRLVADAARSLLAVTVLASLAYAALSVVVPDLVTAVGGEVVVLALVGPYWLVNLGALVREGDGSGSARV